MLSRTLCCLTLLVTFAGLPSTPAHAAPPVDRRDADTAEPTAAETLRAALSYAALNPDRLDGLRTRAAWKDVVPAVGVKARKNQSKLALDKYDYAVSADEKTERESANGDALELEVGASWNLPGLVYNDEVLDVSALQDQQRALAKVVLDTYYARRKLLLKANFAGNDDAEARALRTLEIEQLTSTLDALTGGYFGRRVGEP